MIIGLISDTHDCLPLIDEAVKRLKREKVNLVLHAGDFIAPFTASHFKDLNSKFIGVFGNNEAERDLLKKRFREIGGEIRGNFAEVSADGLKIALLHGHEDELLNSLINSNGYNAVIHGHTHIPKVYRVRDTIIINPGEVCGYISGEATFAIFNTTTEEVEVLSLK